MIERIVIEKCGCEKNIQECGPLTTVTTVLCEQAQREIILTYNEQQHDNESREKGETN